MSYLLILVLLLGFAPAFIARSKGRSFLPWWVYGTVLGPVAMVHAMMMRDTTSEGSEDPFVDDRPERDAPWPVFLWLAASIVIAAVAVVTYRTLVPSDPVRASAPAIATSGASSPQIERRVVGEAPTQPSAPADSGTGAGKVARAVDPQESQMSGSSTRMRSTERAANPAPDAKSSDDAVPIPQVTVPTPLPTPQEPAEKMPQVSVPTPAPPSPAAAAPLREENDRTPLRVGTAPPAAPATPPDAKNYKSALAMRDPSQDPLSSKRRPKTKVRKKPAAPDADVNAVGEIVMIVQRGLAKRGYDPGAINGRAHKKTQNAIRLFQIDRDIEPTGTIDQALLESLNIVGPRMKVFRTPPVAPSGR